MNQPFGFCYDFNRRWHSSNFSSLGPIGDSNSTTMDFDFVVYTDSSTQSGDGSNKVRVTFTLTKVSPTVVQLSVPQFSLSVTCRGSGLGCSTASGIPSDGSQTWPNGYVPKNPLGNGQSMNLPGYGVRQGGIALGYPITVSGPGINNAPGGFLFFISRPELYIGPNFPLSPGNWVFGPFSIQYSTV